MTRRVRGTMAGALLACGVGSVSLALAASYEPPAAQHDEHEQRRLAVGWVQGYSDFVGFEARFQVGEPDTVAVMTGGELCADDVLEVMPRDVGAILRAAGFTRLDCSGAHGERASVDVQP